MKRLPVFIMTAAIAMTGTAAIPAQAAVKAVVIGANGKTCDSFGKPQWGIPGCQILIPGGNGCSNNHRPTCPTPGSCNLPDQNRPDHNRPDHNRPDQNRPDQNRPDQNRPDQPQEDNASFTAQVAALVNEERAKAGLSPLTVDSKVAAAALTRSREIETSFSHTRPDGSSFSTALTQSGVSFQSAGENIAYGQRTPQEVMKGWMNSPGHRANILNKDFTTIGVGYYQNSAGTGYWTQLFTR